MRKDNIRKYILPNIPYLFVLWACLKAGTAYRLAAGADLAHKLVGMTAALGPAFADFAPGLNPFDWLVGIAGAAGIRLLIYCKAKKAKKFRPDAEYGSARWGGPKDMAPFADPKFENNVILTKTEFLTTNTRPKNPANARNLNACVIGSSGSGNTRFRLTPPPAPPGPFLLCGGGPQGRGAVPGGLFPPAEKGVQNQGFQQH